MAIFKSLRKISPFLIFSVFTFIFMYIFFTEIHPIIVYDADDWTYISQSRQAYPLWGAWNPGKVFPEILMPFCGSIAAYIITPITDDYIGSFTIITALLVALAISIYLYLFAQILSLRFSFNSILSITLTTVFFIAHFLIFRTSATDNEYMFWTHNLNCYYNYLIPSLLCFIIVFYSLKEKIYDLNLDLKNPIKSGLILLLIYISLFSNLYSNIVLVVYTGTLLIMHFFKEIRKIKDIPAFIWRHRGLFAIILLWGVMAVFELSGGRAQMASNEIGFIALLKTSVINLYRVIRYSMNRTFLIAVLIVLTAFVILLFKKKHSDLLLMLCILFSCIFVIAVYYLLLCSKVNTEHISSCQYTFGLFAYILVTVTLILSYLIKCKEMLAIILPLLICIMFFETNTSLRTFKESNTPNISPSVCLDVNRDLIQQIISADEQNLSEMLLYVPVAKTDDNWPHATYLGARISNTLYKHGIIKKTINIKIVPDSAMNQKYHIE